MFTFLELLLVFWKAPKKVFFVICVDNNFHVICFRVLYFFFEAKFLRRSLVTKGQLVSLKNCKNCVLKLTVLRYAFFKRLTTKRF